MQEQIRTSGKLHSVLDTSFHDVEAQKRAHELGAAFRRSEPVTDLIAKEISTYKFYHRLDVVPGVRTAGLEWAPQFQSAFYDAAKTIDFRGKRVLDVGCRDGAMLFFAEEQGAKELVGVDNDPSLGLTNFLIPFRGSKIKSYGANIYDLRPSDLGQFDIVISCGLLYHLRYPMFGIKRLSDMLSENGVLLLETAIVEDFDDFPMLFCPHDDQSPYESTSISYFNFCGLQNALRQAAIRDAGILKRFNTMEFDPKAAFPRFAKTRGNATLRISRAIISGRKGVSPPLEVERYFEGRHRYHTTGHF